MASGFPGSIDNFTDPTSTSALNSPSHSGQHADLNDAVEKIETYMGLVKVIPTSVTNGTLAANGTVTVGNAVSSVTVSGAFSSLYDNYQIVMAGIGGSTGANYLFSLSGITTGYYGSYYYDLFNGTSTGTARRSNASDLYIGTGTTVAGGAITQVVVSQPYLSTRTSVAGNNYGGGYAGWFAGETTSTSSATGFVVSFSTGTMTGGTIRVYGYRN